MLTGAFGINNAAKTSAKQFYVKSLKKLLPLFLIFAIVYPFYEVFRGRIEIYEVWIGLYKGFLGYYAH